MALSEEEITAIAQQRLASRGGAMGGYQPRVTIEPIGNLQPSQPLAQSSSLSDDDITRIAQQRLSSQQPTTQQLLGADGASPAVQAGRMTAGALSRMLPFNIGDELSAGGATAINYLRNIGSDFDPKYDYEQNLQNIRNWQTAYQQENPNASLFTDIGSAFLLPFKSGIAGKTGVLGKTIQAAKEGAALGALYGYGAGTGDEKNRILSAADAAKKTALISGALGAVVGGAQKAAPILDETGMALRRKAYGARASDYTKSADELGIWDVQNGEVVTPTKEVLNDVIRNETLGSGVKPSKLLGSAITRQSELGKKVGAIIDNYDSSGGAPVTPIFNRALNYITSGKVKATDADKYVNEIIDLQDAIKQQGGGALRFLQNQRKVIGESYEVGNASRNGFNKALYQDIKEAIEGATPDVQGLNQELSKLKVVRPILERNLGGSESGNIVTRLMQALRTSGGTLTTPTILGGILGGSAGGPVGAAAGAALTAAASPAGQNLIGKALMNAPEAISNAASRSMPVIAQQESPYREIARQLTDVKTGPRRPSSNIPDDTIRAFNKAFEIQSAEASMVPSEKPSLERLLPAIRKVESGGNDKAVSKAGAKGPYQLMDQLGKEYHRRLGIKEAYDPFNEPQAKKIAGAFLEDLLAKYDDPRLAYIGFNWGETKLDRLLKRTGAKSFDDLVGHVDLPLESAQYVGKVNSALKKIA